MGLVQAVSSGQTEAHLDAVVSYISNEVAEQLLAQLLLLVEAFGVDLGLAGCSHSSNATEEGFAMLVVAAQQGADL